MAMQRTLMVNDHAIRYQVIGEGSPVMLVHGFGEDQSVWENQVPVLQRHFRVILPDLPGSGESALTDDVSMEGMAKVLKAILDELAIESCIMVGHSMGGYVTLAFADLYHGSLRALGLFHSSS